MSDRKPYPFVGAEKYLPPDYERVVRRLSDAELADEIEAGRGDDGYREAARRELDRRQEER